jgi:hypothetical protein
LTGRQARATFFMERRNQFAESGVAGFPFPDRIQVLESPGNRLRDSPAQESDQRAV